MCGSRRLRDRKTWIASRLALDSFNDNPGATIGASNFNHIFNFGDTDLKLDIWDTAGQEVYRSLNRIFYKDAQIAILAYDITNENSFKHISSIWLPQVKECVDPSAIIVICGNKCDRYNEEQVKEEEAKKYAENIGQVSYRRLRLEELGLRKCSHRQGNNT